MPEHLLGRTTRLVRPQDFVWLLLFAALYWTLPHHDIYDTGPLVALAVVQLLEPKIPALASTQNRMVWIVFKLVLAYLLIGFTDSITSRYWLVMLLPVVSAATTLGAAGTFIFSCFAAIVYLSFLIWPRGVTDELRLMMSDRATVTELGLRAVFLGMAGNLVNTLAEELRLRSKQYKQTADQLAEANQQIREAEEAVRRSDRLAALGQLSAGLAHELRNPLGTIRASSEMLNRSVSTENDVAREVSGFIATEVDRANSLITRFLQFARPLQPKLEVADLTQTVDRAIGMVERESPGVTIYRNFEPGIRPFPHDSELMERVIFNLVQNAVQATPAGGAVTVKTRAAGGMAEISVIDRGSGIDPKDRTSIFNPFFTTKPAGVGLGLAIVAKIVDEHGGNITVESEPGKGSVFRVLLPMG